MKVVKISRRPLKMSRNVPNFKRMKRKGKSPTVWAVRHNPKFY